LELNQGLEVLHDLMRVHSAHRAKVILLNRLRLTMKVNTDGKRDITRRACVRRWRACCRGSWGAVSTSVSS
jgi:hypothetical protein